MSIPTPVGEDEQLGSSADPGPVFRSVPAPTAGGGTVAWFHCFAGIAGDMALGSLLDAGADFDQVMGLLERLPLGGWALEREPVLRGGIAGTKAVVTVHDSVVVRTHAHIVGLIEEARLPERITRRALATFGRLAVVEARLHNRPVDQVHFHEVGGHDAVIDIVGTVAALEVLGVDSVESSPVATGLGMMRTAHGMLPNPAPAVVALLEGVPTWGRNVPVELTTPTGAALLSTLATGFGPMPPMRVRSSGFGAGTRELDDLPNLTQVVVGSRIDRISGDDLAFGAGSDMGNRGDKGVPDEFPRSGGPTTHPDADAGQPVTVLEATIDDATGEQLAHAVSTLLDAGAHDAWLAPVVMKKGRPGTVVHVLCDPSDTYRLRAILRAETGSLGVRATSAERWVAPRSFAMVEIDGQPVRIKVSPGRVKAEHDDVARAAHLTGVPLREIAFRAEAEWRRQQLHVAPGDDPEIGGRGADPPTHP